MALGNSAEILLKIKADSKDAVDGVNATKGAIAGLGNESAITGAAMTALANPMALAVTAATALATAGIAAAAALFQLTKAAADYGSAIFDATEQTGLGAEAISALKYAADTSGSSLEAITGSVAKFSTLLGQAQNGNEKAAETLKRYGITATETETALGQALKTIADMTDSTQQSAAAADLFKDKTGKLLPVIKSFSGDLPGLIKKVKDLGIAIDDEAAQAADNFGDQLDTLTTQASGVGRQFATELMPLMTSAMAAISQAFSDNKGAAAEWGRALINVINGVSVIVSGFARAMDQTFQVLTLGLVSNASSWVSWGNVLRGVLAAVTFGASEALYALSAIGVASQGDKVGANMGGGFKPGVDLATIPSGGGRGGGGGRGAAPDTPDPAIEAEKQRKAQVEAAKQAMQETLELYKVGYDKRTAQLELSLEQGAIKEIAKIRDVARVRKEALMDEKRLNEQLLNNKNINLNDQERAEILQKIKVLTQEIEVETLKGSKEITAQVKKEIAEKEKLLEVERQRSRELAKRIANEKQAERDKRLQELKDRTEQGTLAGGGFGGGLFASIGIMADKTLNARDKMAAATNGIKASWMSLKDAFKGGLDQFASGIGSIVENFILMGATGPAAMKKLTASVLAGVAAQAAVLAIFELAKGFAALFFNPAEAVAHFKAAALFGTIAIGTGLAGRGIAGDSFKTGGGSSSGSTSSDPQEQRNNFSSGQFGGFGNRVSTTLEAIDESLATFNNKVTTMRAGDVFAAGVDENPNALHGGMIKGFQNNSRLTGELKRATGDAR